MFPAPAPHKWITAARFCLFCKEAAVIRLRAGAGGLPGYTVAALTFALFGPLGWPIHYVLLIVLPLSFAVAWKRARP